jgi:Fe-S-cluster-containing dehydrogenase component
MACALTHENGNVSLAKARLSINREISDNKVNMIICRHCKKPKCLEDCPCGAITLNADGLVLIDESKCVACGNCARNCPFDAVVFIEERNVYQKCDMCYNRPSGPVCVEVCPVSALTVGESNGDR